MTFSSAAMNSRDRYSDHCLTFNGRIIAALLTSVIVLSVSASHLAADTVRFVGRMADGTPVSGTQLMDGEERKFQPSLDGKPLLAADNSVAWLRDRHLAPADNLQPIIEMIGGDCLPGVVVGFQDETVSASGVVPAHLVFKPSIEVNLPGGVGRDAIRVLDRFVHRIVWQPRAGMAASFQPKTVFFRDGRTSTFQSVRFNQRSVSLLMEKGLSQVPFDDIAELHLGTRDVWEAYYDELALVNPSGQSRLVQLETVSGVVATTSEERIATNTTGAADQLWFAVAPAWSLDSFWIHGQDIWMRRAFYQHQIPLTRIAPTVSIGRGGSLPWRANRDTDGGPLVSGGMEHGWGIGVHGRAEIHFAMPRAARSISSTVGLDAKAGKGGCARARMFANSTQSAPLYESQFLIGSESLTHTGAVALPSTPNDNQSLIFQVDEAHAGRPKGADPLDIRDLVDWLEPTLALDPAELQAEIRRRIQHSTIAWDGWQVHFDDQAQVSWETTFIPANGPNVDQFLTGIQVQNAPIELQRELEIDADHRWLMLFVHRRAPSSGQQPEIEVRIDDELITTNPIPVAAAGVAAPSPLVIDLWSDRGKTAKLRIVQLAAPAGAPPVIWNAAQLGDTPLILKQVFEDRGVFVNKDPAAGGQADVVTQTPYSGRRVVKVTPGGRFTLKLPEPIPVRGTPQWGEQRYLRFAMRKVGGGRICLEVMKAAAKPDEQQAVAEGNEEQAPAEIAVRYDAGLDQSGRPTQDRIWFDDELPPGAMPAGRDGDKSWQWVTAVDNPVASGKLSVRRQSKGYSQHFFIGATPGWPINEGDKLFAYVYLDPNDRPKQIMMEWNDGRHWGHRAYWGDNLITYGREGSAERMYAGPLPKAGEWARLEIDAAQVGLPAGSTLHGWAFTQMDGTTWWDKVGTNGPGPPSYGHARRVWQYELPDEWIVVTRDLFADHGEFDLASLTFHVPDGDYALFDHIYVARTVEDLSLRSAKTTPEESNYRALGRLAAEPIATGLPATVAVEVDGRRGTGIVVGERHVLTTGHLLIGEAKDVTITLADGTKRNGKTLGICRDLDCGLVLLDDAFAGKPAQLDERAEHDFRFGKLYVAVARDGRGEGPDRPKAYFVDLHGTLGDILWTNLYQTNPLAGGPLFDRSGRVIGLHLRPTIDRQGQLFAKASQIRKQWNRLLQGETWGKWYPGIGPMIGATITTKGNGAVATEVYPNFPAVQAGIQVGDVIKSANGKPVAGLEELYLALADTDPGQEIPFEIQRGDQTMQLNIRLVHRIEYEP